jgi:hypothetical protein
VATRRRALAFAAALAALFAGLVTWASLGVEGRDAAARAAGDRETQPLPFLPSDVSALTLARRGAPPVVVERTRSGWRLASPSPADASPDAVEAMLARLATLRIRATLPASPAALASRGLDPPASRIVVALRDGRVLRLDLGVESPFDKATFARTTGDILVVEGVPAAALDPTPEALRAPPGGG